MLASRSPARHFDGGIEEPRAIQMGSQSTRGGQRTDIAQIVHRQHLAAGGVLHDHEPGARKVRIVGLDRGFDGGQRDRAIGCMVQRLRLDGAQHRHASRLPFVGVPVLPHDRFVAALAMDQQTQQIGLRARGGKERRLEAQHLCSLRLQAVDGRVIAEHIVAHLSSGHGRAHGG